MIAAQTCLLLTQEIVVNSKRSIFSTIVNLGYIVCIVFYSVFLVGFNSWKISLYFCCIFIVILLYIVNIKFLESSKTFLKKKDYDSFMINLLETSIINQRKKKFIRFVIKNGERFFIDKYADKKFDMNLKLKQLLNEEDIKYMSLLWEENLKNSNLIISNEKININVMSNSLYNENTLMSVMSQHHRHIKDKDKLKEKNIKAENDKMQNAKESKISHNDTYNIKNGTLQGNHSYSTNNNPSSIKKDKNNNEKKKYCLNFIELKSYFNNTFHCDIKEEEEDEIADDKNDEESSSSSENENNETESKNEVGINKENEIKTKNEENCTQYTNKSSTYSSKIEEYIEYNNKIDKIDKIDKACKLEVNKDTKDNKELREIKDNNSNKITKNHAALIEELDENDSNNDDINKKK